MAQFTHTLCEEVIRTEGRVGLTNWEKMQMARLALRTLQTPQSLSPEGGAPTWQQQALAHLGRIRESMHQQDVCVVQWFLGESTMNVVKPKEQE